MRDFTDLLDERLRPLATDFSHASGRFRASVHGVFASTPVQHQDAGAEPSGALLEHSTIGRPSAPVAVAEASQSAPAPASTTAHGASQDAASASTQRRPTARPGRGRTASPSMPMAATGRRFRTRQVAVASASGLVATVASVAVLTGTSAAGLPILDTETSDASAAASAPALRAAGVDLRRGHAFQTANGPGYVLASADGERLCLTAPDTGPARTYSGTCAARAAVERRGLSLEVTGDLARKPDAVNLVVVLLPEGATSPRVTGPQGNAVPRLQAGVFTTALRAPAALSFRTGGTTRQLRFQGPFDGASISCHGKAVPVPAARGGRNGAAGTDRLAACSG